MPPYLEAAIEEHLDPRLYVMFSKNKWEQEEVYSLQKDDETYRQWQKDMEVLRHKTWAREEEFSAAVKMIDTDFSYSTRKVKGFTTYQRNGKTHMEDKDILYYYDLLGELSPYLEDAIKINPIITNELEIYEDDGYNGGEI